jgi:hypothetical protein
MMAVAVQGAPRRRDVQCIVACAAPQSALAGVPGSPNSSIGVNPPSASEAPVQDEYYSTAVSNEKEREA